jgi:RNA polymerase sigma-70 factor (ECF subfamily)
MLWNKRPSGEDPFATEIMTHLDHLYRVAYYLVRNPQDAQDCVQETCARALNSRSQFAVGTNMKAWLTRILYNFFYDGNARKRRMVSVEDLGQSEDQVLSSSLPREDSAPEPLLLNQELSGKIGKALARIPEEFRAPIVLVDMGDCSYAEASEILSCPIGTVRSRLSRGRKLLQKELIDYLGFTGTDR